MFDRAAVHGRSGVAKLNRGLKNLVKIRFGLGRVVAAAAELHGAGRGGWHGLADRSENVDRFARMVDARLLITGHEPCCDGYQVPNSRQIIIDSQSETGCYVILTTTEELSLQQVVERIQRLA